MNDANQSSSLSDKTLDQMAADIAAYTPPSVSNAAPAQTSPTPMTAPTATQAAAASTAYSAPVMPAAPAMPQTPAPAASPTPASMPMADSAQAAQAADKAESLETQNIFELLGVSNGSDADKEAFLDELQQVIWEDFLTSDLQLLLTRAELAEVEQLRSQNPDPAKQQEAVVAYLEKLIPDMEDIMLEKALELKREMVRERVTGMRSYLAGKADKLAELDKVQELLRQEKWASVARALNSLAAS